jgi:NAD-dependent deacetylase
VKDYEKLQKMIDESNNIVFFGGAGVSTESNIPDFRSADGLYQQQYKYSPEQIVSHSFFKRHTEAFYDFYKEKMMYLEAKPNPAHVKLAELEATGKVKAVVTQNIDGLHQMAGSKKVFELHGSVHRNYCTHCKTFYDSNFILEENVKNPDGIPRCKKCNHIVKPDVVLYEEPLDNDTIDVAINAISQADTLIIGGTSLVVYPASGLVRYFKGKNLVIINMSPTDYDKNSTLLIQGKIGEVLSNIKC